MLSDLVKECLSDNAVILEGFNRCVIGIGSVFPHDENVLIYDVGKIIDLLMERDGMDFEEAHEYYAYNIAGAHMGEGNPILMSDKISGGDIVMAPLK